MRCARLSAPGPYQLHNIPDGIYHLRSAAFPLASDLHTSLLPGANQLLAHNASPLIIRHGHIVGNPDLHLHAPQLTDPPLVMGLPLL